MINNAIEEIQRLADIAEKQKQAENDLASVALCLRLIREAATVALEALDAWEK